MVDWLIHVWSKPLDELTLLDVVGMVAVVTNGVAPTVMCVWVAVRRKGR